MKKLLTLTLAACLSCSCVQAPNAKPAPPAAAKGRVGQMFDILIDDEDEHWWIGRHAGQAPEVDAVCLVDSDKLETGQFVKVKCVEADDYDLIVRPRSLRLATLPPVK